LVFGIKEGSHTGDEERDAVTGGCRKQYNEELLNLESYSSILRMMKSQGILQALHVAHMGEKRNAYRLLVGKCKGKNH
jgi:hypothetical protein